MTIWRTVNDEEWIDLIETQILDLNKHFLQAEDVMLKLLTKSHSFFEIAEKEANNIFDKQDTFNKLTMSYKGINFMMIINLYNRLFKLKTFLNMYNIKNQSFETLYQSLYNSYNYLIKNIDRHVSDQIPLYLQSEEITNPIIIDKRELQRYILEES